MTWTKLCGLKTLKNCKNLQTSDSKTAKWGLPNVHFQQHDEQGINSANKTLSLLQTLFTSPMCQLWLLVTG